MSQLKVRETNNTRHPPPPLKNLKIYAYVESHVRLYVTVVNFNFSTKFIKNALIHVIKNGKTGHVWIAENEEPPRLANFSDQY